METLAPFIALTDARWFRFLATQSVDGRVDEVNFWSPRSTRKIKRFTPGEPVFFLLKRPHHAAVGHGFFAHSTVIGLSTAWECFGWRNGDPDRAQFLQRIGTYRGKDLLDPRRGDAWLECTILRDVRFWPRENWIPWGAENDLARARLLLDRILLDHAHQESRAEYEETFELLDVDDRRLRDAHVIAREGQGTFRTRLPDAYGCGCAITGERTEPVLDAAHIQPYLGPRSNHLQNGLLLTKGFHELFDEGYVTVTPDARVEVSPAPAPATARRSDGSG